MLLLVCLCSLSVWFVIFEPLPLEMFRSRGRILHAKNQHLRNNIGVSVILSNGL